MNVETRRWWRDGVHVEHAYRNFTRDELPITESLGARVFGLPFFYDLSDAQIGRVFESVSPLKTALNINR